MPGLCHLPPLGKLLDALRLNALICKMGLNRPALLGFCQGTRLELVPWQTWSMFICTQEFYWAVLRITTGGEGGGWGAEGGMVLVEEACCAVATETSADPEGCLEPGDPPGWPCLRPRAWPLNLLPKEQHLDPGQEPGWVALSSLSGCSEN